MPSFSSEEELIFFGNLRCNGSEKRLIDCGKSSYYYISQYQASVRCQFNPSSGNVIILSFPFHKVPPYHKELKLCPLHQPHLAIRIVLL